MHIIGSSIPRSGHHFFIRLVKGVLEKDMMYCEFYSQNGCCGQIPCTKANRKPLTFQKNHDFEFGLPILDDQEYLIQTRDPAPQVLSHIEIASPLVKSNQHERDYWLSGRIQYFWRFHDKWVRPKRSNFMLVDYDDLSACPAAVLGMFFQRYGLAVDMSKIAEAAEAVSKRRSVNGKTVAYVPRKIEPKENLDLETLGIIESAVISEVPELEPKRKLPRSNFAASHLYWHAKALEALNGTTPALGYEWARLCVEEAPENPMYQFTLARICKRMDKPAQARKAIERALDLSDGIDQFVTRLNRLQKQFEPAAKTKTTSTPGAAKAAAKSKIADKSAAAG